MPAYKDQKFGTWYVKIRYTDWTGKRKETTKRGFAKKKDAQEYEINFKKQQTGIINMPFSSLYNLYMEDVKPRVRATTYQGKTFLFESKVLPFFKDIPCDQITPVMIRKWQNNLIDQGYSPTYLKTVNNQLSAIFNFAVRYYNLPSNPAVKAGGMGKKHAEVMQFWTVSEFDLFIDKTSNIMYKTIFTLLFGTGMREGEMLALTLNDFDFDKKLVHVTKSFARIDGDDLISPPKTPKSKRDITLPRFVLELVKEYTTHLYDYKPDYRLFVITKHSLYHEMIRTSKAAGVKRIRIHDLRHSHASYLIEKNASVLAISERLGHDNIETTLRTYSHLYPDKHNAIADLIEKDRRDP